MTQVCPSITPNLANPTLDRRTTSSLFYSAFHSDAIRAFGITFRGGSTADGARRAGEAAIQAISGNSMGDSTVRPDRRLSASAFRDHRCTRRVRSNRRIYAGGAATSARRKMSAGADLKPGAFRAKIVRSKT